MSKESVQKETRVLKPVSAEQASEPTTDPRGEAGGVLDLQQKIGNRAVQRMLAQRDDGGLQLDDETAGRISEARGGGQGLDAGIQDQMGAALDHDLSGVKVHTDAKADTLSRDLNAEAFTTGQDIFFRRGSYEPGSDSGKELLAHELTHVVQQGTGAVSSGQGMTVNPPDDVYEQEADAVAQQVVHAGSEAATAGVAGGTAQRQEEEELQTRTAQRQEEEEEMQAKPVQRQEEEELQTSAVQRQEEEELQTRRVQRQEEEEEMQAKAVQRQEEEEEMQAKPVQRQEELPEEEV